MPATDKPDEPREGKPEETHPVVREHIDLIYRLEKESLARRSFLERAADAVGDFLGSAAFLLLHATVFTLYFLINLRHIPWIPVFDPYPFELLSMATSVEALFLSTFVLMKQNRMGRRADSRTHLDLQINLLTEKEITLVLQMLRVMGEHMGVSQKFETGELQGLAQVTPVEQLATELDEKMPE
ncbi:MAG TPA: DUF1003 domain-containing protein [Solibacterales bacterium]|nr:DUF1003 domain-containing protein [Bryobacterales bacterium]